MNEMRGLSMTGTGSFRRMKAGLFLFSGFASVAGAADLAERLAQAVPTYPANVAEYLRRVKAVVP